MGTATDLKQNTMVLTSSGYMPYGQAQSAGLANQDVQAVSDAMASDARLSQLENNVPSNVPFTVDDYLQGIDVSDGISEDETNLAFDLLSTGAVTVADLEAKTGIPASAIQSTYDTIAAANAAQAEADLAAEIAAADAEERRVTESLNEFGETYAEEQARLALERSAENDAIMKQNAANAAAVALAEEAAARQAEADAAAAQAAAASPEAAETQRKDDDFDAKVNAAGGVTPGTIDKVIDVALEVYGDDSRGVAKVISESLKGGLTMKDLEEATDLSGDEIMDAAKTAANDPNKSLTPGEILSGGTNTVYDITNKIVDIVETGLEVTGIEKVIDTIGNTVSKVVGLDPNQTQKVLVVNPTTGQVTVQASNIPGGGVLSSLPQSPYVPIGNTSGGTTYGIDAENAVINVVLGKILTNGGLDQGDTKTIIGAAVEEVAGVPMEVAVGVINSAEDLVKGAVKTVKDSGVLAGSGNRQDDEAALAENTGFEVITGGEGDTTLTGGTGNDTSTSATDGLMGPFQLDEDGNTIVDTGQSNTTITAGTGDTTLTGGTGNDTITGSTSATDGLMGPFQLDEDGNTILPSSSTSNTTLTLAPTVTANTPCDNSDEVRDPVTLVCGKPTGGGGTDKIICPDTYNNAKAEVDSLDQCGGLKSTSTVVDEDEDKTVVVDGVTNVVNYVCREEGAVYNPVTERCEKTTTTTLDETDVTDVTVCPEGSEKDANGNCINKITGQVTDVTVCPEGSEKDANGNCINKITGQVTEVTVCPEGSEKDANGNCVVTTYMDTIENKICPDGSYELDGICYSDVTGEVVENTICPAGTTYNETSGQCEYSKYLCPPGFTFNILTSQCEPDDEKEEETGGITTLPTPDLKVPGRGDFVTADDVLVENTGDVGGIYSMLPAPVREPFLAGRRQQDIRNVADTVGIQQGAELEQDQAAVDRFAGYANAFDVGTPELLNISGVLPGDSPAYEEKFGVQFPEVGIAPPVRPDEDLFPIAGARFDPTTYTPTAMAAGGVVERENGIESLMDRRQQAVNRMLIKRAGSHFGR